MLLSLRPLKLGYCSSSINFKKMKKGSTIYFLNQNIFSKFFGSILSGAFLALCTLFGIVYFSNSASAANVNLNSASQNCIASNRAVDLTWSSDITGSVVYRILRKLSMDADYTEVGNTANMNYTDNAALSGKIYLYKIKAEQGIDIFYSNEINVSANYCSPAIIENSALCKVSGPYNNISWTSASGDLSRYEIWRDGAKIGNTIDLSYSDESAISGTSVYAYFIKTFWTDGISRDSDVISITASACPPILSVNSGCKNNISPGGPIINLSWNNLSGATRYDIYREMPDGSNMVIASSFASPYTDDLVASSPLSYWQTGIISYRIKAFFGSSVNVDSEISQINVPRCNPFLSTAGVCDASGNPEMRLGWTRTMDSSFYNIYRDNTLFLGQASGSAFSYSDYLDSSNCSTNGISGICGHNYAIKASVTGFSEYFISNTATQSIDCVTVVPPSPEPILNNLNVFCEAGKSKIELNWIGSSNAVYYTIYRNNIPLINISGTSYIDAGVESGVGYSYRIVAFGRGGTNSTSSNTETASAFSCVPPGNSFLALSKSCFLGIPQVSLAWTPTGNTVEYEIKKGLSEANMETKIIINSDAVTTLTDTDNLSPGTPYYYQVFSRGVLGVAPSPSNNNFITTDSCFPTTPVSTVTPECSGGVARIKVSWTSNNSNTQRYEIFREGTGFIESIPANPLSTYYERFYNVSPGILYKYKVEAVGYVAGQRTTQGYKTVTSYTCSLPGAFTLSEPSGVCQGSYPQVNLNWTASANATSYDIARNRLNPAETNIFSNKTSPYTDMGLGNALQFDGLEDYASIPNAASLSPTKITLEAWIYPTSFNYYGNIINKRNPEQYILRLNGYTGQVDGYIYSNGGWRYCTTPSSIAVALNQLNHLSFVYDGNIGRVYINGQSGCSFSYSGNIAAGTSSLKIGTNYTYATANERFKGKIDEVRVYNRALNSSEITEHYQGIYTIANEAGSVGIWHFDENIGQSISDSSNLGNNGVLGASSAVEGSDPVWIQNGLIFQSQYNWKIEAKNAGGSNFSSITAPLTIPLCAPVKAGLRVDGFCQGGTKGAVNLSWSYSLNANRYEIYRDGIWIKTVTSADPEFNSRVWIDNNNGDGLKQETPYSYYVNSVGVTELITQSSVQSDAVPLCVLPAVPQNVTAEFGCPVPGVSGNIPQIKISWDAVDNASSYSVYRNNMACGGFPASPTRYCLLLSTSSNFYNDNYSSVSVNAAYSYIVRSNNVAGQSDASNPPVSIPVGKYCTPSVPAVNPIITACQIDNTPVNTIFWNDATVYNTQKYEIYRKLAPEASFSLLTTVNKGTAAFASRVWEDAVGFNSAAANSASYKIKAIGPTTPELASGFSSTQTKDTYACAAVPDAPAGLTVNSYCSENKPYANIFWNSSPSAYSYNLYRLNPDASTSVYSTVLSPKTDVGSRALKFDGANDYVNIPANISNPNGVTIEAWVKPDSFIDTNGTIYLAGAQSSMQGFSWLYITSSRIYYQFTKNGGVVAALPAVAVTWTAGQWYHLVVTHDYSKKEIRFYRDGAQVGSTAYIYIGDVISVINKPIKIGAYSATQNRFHGTIDEVRVYDRSLSLSEVGEHYNNNYKNETALLGAWHFDEKNTVIVSDSSGNGRNGKISGPEWSDGKDNGALQFGGIDGYVQLPAFNLSQAVTVEAWVYAENSLANSSRIMDFGNGSANNNIILAFSGTTGKMVLATYQGTVSGGSIITTDIFPQNQWVHVAAVVNGYGNGSIYWDGVLKKTGIVGIPLSLSRTNQYIGKSNWSSDAYFNGKIDEFRVYRRALSSTEIGQHKDGNFSDDPSLAILLHMDEKSGTSVADSSGNGGDGVLKIGTERVDSNVPVFVAPFEGGNTYKFSVKAAGINNLSGSLSEISIDAPMCLPVTPVLTADSNTCSGSNTQVSLSWPFDANVSYWTVYKNGAFYRNTAVNSLIDTDVASGSTYTYYIRAFGYIPGSGILSNSIDVMIDVCSNAPDMPIISSVERQCAGFASRLKVIWTPYNSSNTLSFAVYRINFAAGETFESATPIFENLPSYVSYFLDGGVSYKTGGEINKYIYKIKAIGSGESLISASSGEFEALDCANMAPTDFILFSHLPVSYNADIGGVASIKWTDSTAETSYKIFRRVQGTDFAYEINNGQNNKWPEFIKSIFMKNSLAANDYTDISLLKELILGDPINGYNDNPPVIFPDTVGYIYYADYTVSEDTVYDYQVFALNSKGQVMSGIISVSVPVAFPGAFSLSYFPINLNEIGLGWTKAETTVKGGPITYKLIKSSTSDFSVSEPVLGCGGVTGILDDDPISNPKRSCTDNDFSLVKKYYRAIATNAGGSSIDDLTVSILSNWREVIPQ